jgi:DNA-binding Lrp family transcriptional regulator
MAAKAFILIEVTASQALRVLDEVKKLDGVKLAYAITGRYDIIAMVEADEMADIGRLCLNRVHTIEGVLRTITCHVVEF